MHHSPSPVRKLQRQLSSKLKIIDDHFINKQTIKSSNSEYQHVMKMISLKLHVQPAQQIPAFMPKTISFDNLEPKKFCIKSQTAPPKKKFILRVVTHVTLRINIKIDQKPATFYIVSSNKAIAIDQLSFQQLDIQIKLEKMTIMSSSLIKIHLDLLQTQHKSNKKASINLRPNINKQLQEYLQLNKGRSHQILRQRRLQKQKKMASTARTFSTGARSLSQRAIAMQKADFMHFQRSKSFYIKHVRKMSPEKTKVLKTHQQKYGSKKRSHLQKLSIFFIFAKFARLYRNQAIQLSNTKMRQVKVYLLCKKFINIVKNKFKLKMTPMARYRMTFFHTLHYIPKVFLRDTGIKQARKIVKDFLFPFMDYRMIQEVAAYSQEMLIACKNIQEFLRFKQKNYIQRIIFLIEKLCFINRIDLLNNYKIIVAKKYLSQCKKTEKWSINIHLNRERLLQLIKQYAN